MKINAIYNEKLYSYEENIWTGRKNLYVNGEKCNKIGKKDYVDPETKELIVLKGSFLSNIKIEKRSESFYLVKNSAFDWVFICLSFVVLLMSFALLSGGLGGALGGGLSVLAATFNVSILRSKTEKWLKALFCILISAGACLAWWLIYPTIAALIFL